MKSVIGMVLVIAVSLASFAAVMSAEQATAANVKSIIISIQQGQ